MRLLVFYGLTVLFTVVVFHTSCVIASVLTILSSLFRIAETTYLYSTQIILSVCHFSR